MFVLHLQGFHNNKVAEWPAIPLQDIKIVKFNVVVAMTKRFLFTIQRHFYTKKCINLYKNAISSFRSIFNSSTPALGVKDQFIFLKCK